jgi:ankyrin repeat protein
MQKNLKEGEITMKRIAIILFLINVCNLCGMQSPSKSTGKRRGQDLQEPFAKSIATDKEAELNLTDLPLELQTKIRNFIFNVSGATNEAKLYKAADNLRNFMIVDKSYYAWLNTPLVVNDIIRELAKRYTADNDFIAVVLALGTNSASKWLASRVFDAIKPNDQGFLTVINEPARDFILRLSEHLGAAFLNNQFDKYMLLTKHVEPRRRAWLINNLEIRGLPLLSFLILNNRMKQFDHLITLDGIDLNREDSKDNTPVIAAIQRKNIHALQNLIARGAQLNVLNSANQTPLVVAIEVQNESAVALIVNNPATDLNAEDLSEDTPLHKAVAMGNENIFNMLLEAGRPERLNINRAGSDGDTPLMRAAAHEKPYFIDQLIRAGAALNAKNDAGQTALMFAAQNENNAPLMLLIEVGANLNEVDSEGHTALWHARNKNMQQNIRSLERAGARE